MNSNLGTFLWEVPMQVMNVQPAEGLREDKPRGGWLRFTFSPRLFHPLPIAVSRDSLGDCKAQAFQAWPTVKDIVFPSWRTKFDTLLGHHPHALLARSPLLPSAHAGFPLQFSARGRVCPADSNSFLLQYVMVHCP